MSKKQFKPNKKKCSCGRQKEKCVICSTYFCPDCEIGNYLDPTGVWFCAKCKTEIDKEWDEIMNKDIDLTEI